MKVYTTILGVTGISVHQGTTGKSDEPVRDIVVASQDGEVIIRLVGQERNDLQVNFVTGQEAGEKGGEQRGWKRSLKEQVLD
jgi:hypothetical protein